MSLVLVENAGYPVTPRRESQKFFHRARIIRTTDSSAWPKFPLGGTGTTAHAQVHHAWTDAWTGRSEN